MRNMRKEMIRKLVETCYPPRCPGCDDLLKQEERAIGFCGKCRKEIRVVDRQFCMNCGKPLGDARREYCPDCVGGKHMFSQGRTVFCYRGVMKGAMYRFKYGNRRGYGRIFARWAVRAHGPWIRGKRPDVIVPIPLYFPKQRRRGYNQALVWGRALGKELGLPVESRTLFRIRATRPQKELDPAGRSANLRGAFYAGREAVAGRRVLLVDDIYTTGSTMDEAAKTLLEAGAQQVFALSICAGR